MMRKHWRYLQYVLRHKWYVFVYGWRLGIPWLALLHDNSKFLPSEWFPYAEFFYGERADRSAGEAEAVDAAFDIAWLRHQRRNKHHWQWWVLINDEDPRSALPMPDRYRREMVADWRGAGRAITGTEDALGWYRKNRDKMMLHRSTRAWVEAELGYIAQEVASGRTRGHGSAQRAAQRHPD